jgi:hypothetical protein
MRLNHTQAFHRGGLARAVAAEQAVTLPFRHRETQALNRIGFLVGIGKIGNLNRIHRFIPPLRFHKRVSSLR